MEIDIAKHRGQASRTTPSLLLKFNWSPEAVDRLKLRLTSPSFQLQIQILEARTKAENSDIDAIVLDFSNLQFRKRGPPSKIQKATKKWYDQSLKSQKQA